MLIETSPGPGVQILGPSHTQARLTQNTVRTNGGSGLVLDATTAVRVDNTVLVGNAGHGVLVLGGGATNSLANLTVADNLGTGVFIEEGTEGTQLSNTILWGNGLGLVDAGDETVLTTNLTTDPGFVGGGNYQIASGASPAVDTGTPQATGIMARDGVLRPQGAGWDIGAYEIPGTPAAPGALSVMPWGARGFLSE
jgi:hypothetical protein